VGLSSYPVYSTSATTVIPCTSGTVSGMWTNDYGNYSQLAQLQNALNRERTPVADGTKPIVICCGGVTEAKDMDEAQRIAESQAHSKSADAYILKPVKRIAPKREVVTVEL